MEDYWYGVDKLTDSEGVSRFPVLSKLIQGLLVIPYGNADVEQLFSHINQIKTKKRNLIHDDTLNVLLHIVR